MHLLICLLGNLRMEFSQRRVDTFKSSSDRKQLQRKLVELACQTKHLLKMVAKLQSFLSPFCSASHRVNAPFKGFMKVCFAIAP